MTTKEAMLKESGVARSKGSLEQLLASKAKQAARFNYLAASGIFKSEDLKDFSTSILDLDKVIQQRMASIRVTAQASIRKEASLLSG